MKILALRGENLASIQQPFEIDFINSRLGEAGLFAITGKTGAGKSTLLDAICLALYDRMPRLQANKKNDAEIGLGEEATKLKANDVRSILSRGKAEGFAEVDFTANDGSVWRAHWHVRRARGKADGRVQASEQWLENLENGQRFAGKKQEVLNEIERLVGLSYEQFRRAVMLPQGDFAAFLKASADERAALLERMTGGEIYSRLSVAAYEKAKAEKNALDTLQAKLGDIRILPEEEKTALTEQLTAEKAALESLLAQLETLKANRQTVLQHAELEKALIEALAQREEAEKALAEAAPRRDELGMVEKVQPARADFSQLQQTELTRVQLTKAIEVRQATLDGLSGQILASSQGLDTAQSALKTQESQWQETEPKIRRAAAMDSELGALRQQLASTQSQLREREANIQRAHADFEQKRRVHAQLEAQIARFKQELAQFGDFAAIAEQYQPVLDNLEQYLAANRQFAEAEREIGQLQQFQVQVERELAEVERHQQALSQDKQQLEDQLAASDRETLEQAQQEDHKRYEQLQYRHEQYRKLQLASNEWLNLLQHKARLSKDKANLTSAIESATQQLSELEPTFRTRVTQYEEAEHALNQSMAVVNLAEYRAQLTEGEPCPLCGSEHHPYREQNPLVEGMLSQQRQRLQTLHAELRQLESERHYLNQQRQQAQSQLPQWEQQWQELNAYLQRQKSAMLPLLDAFDEDQEHLEHDDPNAFGSWVDESHQKAKTNYQEMEALYHALEQRRQRLGLIQQWQQQLMMLGQKENQLQTHAHQITQQKTQSEERIKAQQSRLVSAQETIASRHKALDELYGDSSWLNMLQHFGAERYIHDMQLRIKQYLSLRNELQASEQQLAPLVPEIAALEQELKSLQKHQQEAVESFNRQAATVQQQTQQRMEILAVEDLAGFESALKAELETARQTVKTHESALAAMTEQRAAERAALEAAESQKKEAEKQHRDVVHRWMKWQQEFNLTESALMQLLARDSNWINAERSALKALDDALQVAQTRISERQGRLDAGLEAFELASAWLAEHGAEDDEKSLQLKTALESQKAETEESVFALRRTLDASAQAEVQAGELKAQLEAQQQNAEMWMKIADLIGSASGNKFRNLAQSLTLQQLVLEANVHLQELAPRYALQTVPSSPLSLQVRDHDMGDEVRSVESLSGGESFLVSLALALALASLAADTRQLGSLFIDEGFGTLDPDSLEMALACLDTLQADGRQIGVISHVGTLVERIGTQVAVEALGGGVSRVCVRG